MQTNNTSSLISQPNDVRCSTQVQTSITGCYVNVCEQVVTMPNNVPRKIEILSFLIIFKETQTSISGQVLNLTPFHSSNDFLIAEKFNWSSSTQTSPRIVNLFDSQDLVFLIIMKKLHSWFYKYYFFQMATNTRDFSTNIDESKFIQFHLLS